METEATEKTNKAKRLFINWNLMTRDVNRLRVLDNITGRLSKTCSRRSNNENAFCGDGCRSDLDHDRRFSVSSYFEFQISIFLQKEKKRKSANRTSQSACILGSGIYGKKKLLCDLYSIFSLE